jgi:tetratricopeptide (TPR) repeat protein
LYLARRYDEAIQQYLKVIDLDEGFPLAHRRLAQTYEQIQRYTEADVEFQKAVALSGEDIEVLSARGHFYAVVGEADKAREVLAQLEDLAKSRYVPSYLVARIYYGLDDNDRVFELMDGALEERYGYLVYLDVEPMFDGLRADPRYEGLVSRVGLR